MGIAYKYIPGRVGVDGLPGVEGAQGPEGSQGPPGYPGSPGPNGSPGTAGPPGRSGSVGPPGEDGKDAKSYEVVSCISGKEPNPIDNVKGYLIDGSHPLDEDGNPDPNLHSFKNAIDIRNKFPSVRVELDGGDILTILHGRIISWIIKDRGYYKDLIDILDAGNPNDIPLQYFKNPPGYPGAVGQVGQVGEI
ncbi:hypothetical protein [Aureibacter tunicatorum]|uniref:Collagen triple helix repeat protein n=1 Tax=Aureibacter tunicatorum TaxID=866807 RepID=A0AAE3XUE7_9BACT|nr:hypothetical protein [Aureibacter tunicatorum]MDR6241879.1 hypothetical protein [Aureibacter tunicatorum]BDD07486.1 hypothetical protein AUTU_49690 [Aureibacter tunicatorum]